MIPSPCNILVGIISGGTVRAELIPCLFGALDVLKGHGVGVNIACQTGGYAAQNRNELTKLAKSHKSDYLMFIDNDMTFPNSGIQRLLDADKDIIGVHYNARPKPGTNKLISTVKTADPFNDVDFGKVTEGFPAQTFKCFSVGTGFTLIRMNIFDRIPFPWFESGETEKDGPYTEDVDFFRKANEAGFEIYCNPTIKMGHIGTQEY